MAFKKIGVLAPGMCQTITISFTPKEYTYYYDCIRINCEGQNLLVPIHGYPIVNKIDFPKQISFGNSPLCEVATKVYLQSLCKTIIILSIFLT